jgi:hypothetical protein
MRFLISRDAGLLNRSPKPLRIIGRPDEGSVATRFVRTGLQNGPGVPRQGRLARMELE